MEYFTQKELIEMHSSYNLVHKGILYALIKKGIPYDPEVWSYYAEREWINDRRLVSDSMSAQMAVNCLFHKGLYSLERGFIKESDTLFNQCDLFCGGFSKCHYNLGVKYMDISLYGRAVNCFKKALRSAGLPLLSLIALSITAAGILRRQSSTDS